ncbi:hypothetical protein FA15DRAFT_664345 [Coprinopsis marcescibilis]|uniref:CID domain-containing protein n=1 Tax=Coprinopsis marcescibilis TaxID=230819 RepID=A0A5C3LBN3_COPMA|nr:hypothetical protein FA15DRAFT_664345 [Coprinopsis marcescibilis]
MYAANMYGQPPFGGHGPAFHPPPVNNYYASSSQYQQYMPPPPPVHQPPTLFHVDPNEFRKHYVANLAELTFNSRTIIQELSLLAQNYSRYADIVVSSVESHIRRVPPPFKLPAFYLLDAISKNVYDPYARRFASVVTQLFLDTYSQVDAQTRTKMDEMLLTWRTGSPARTELFGSVTQLAIERGVHAQTIRTRQTPIDHGQQISKRQVLDELQVAINQKDLEVRSNLYDEDAKRKLGVLHQLQTLIQGPGVSPEDLRQILGQLRDLVKGSAPPPPPRAPSTNVHGAWQQPVQYPPAQPPHYLRQTGYPSSSFTTPQPHSQPIASTSTSEAAVPDAENIARILDSLKNAGVLPAPDQAQAPEPLSAPKPVSDVDTSKITAREYKSDLLGQVSRLTSADILRTKPSLANFVYNRLPSQCKQCGLRFADTAYGKKKMEQHLDMHFKQNRQGSQNIGRGHCRTWFVGVEDWIRTGSNEDKGKARANPSLVTSANAPVKSEKELRSQFVVVPAGDEAKNVSCPICKESMKTEFLEDDEEWVWRNAVVKDDKIYHATCHAEALSSTSGIAARLRNDILASSRGATPDAFTLTPPRKSESPSPDPAQQGIKRKVESTDDGTGTPPTKKQALSPLVDS